MNVLLLSSGGGGGNILRSVKALFHRDLAVTQRADAAYAARLRSAVTTCFLDTNEFSLLDLPAEEKVLIGPHTTGRLGARHNPDVARQALAESRTEVEALINRHSVIILIATGGKGTGAGTIFPLAQMARQQKKLVIPVFVRPSFERHEVDKRRYDHAVAVSQQFDAAKIRFVEVLNDRGYIDTDPKPQSAVWEQMNLPIARALRGLVYVLWDLSQVDPSDLSTLFAGHGRLRLGFGEIDSSAGHDPDDAQVERAVRDCWRTPYYAFSKPAGTSLICIQGDWSNVVDARIKGRLAELAIGGAADSPYTPLFARAFHAPRPWGVTTLFAEHTGTHVPVVVEWPFERGVAPPVFVHVEVADPVSPAAVDVSAPVSAKDPIETLTPSIVEREPATAVHTAQEQAPQRAFATLWEFAVAVNRSDPAALAVAGDGAKAGFPIEGSEVKKLAGTVWFRTVAPKLSEEWRTRLLDALVETVEVANHVVKFGRRTTRLKELTYAELETIAPLSVPDVVRSDLEMLQAIGRLWGGEALSRLRFVDEDARAANRSRLMTVLHSFRA